MRARYQRLNLFLLCVLLLALLAASAPASTARAEPPAQVAWEAGDYSGWVYLLARITKNHKIQQEGANLTQDTVVFWQAHGDVSAQVDAAGQGKFSAYLPLEITAMEVGSFSTAAGSCSFNVSAKGEAYPQSLAMLASVPLTDKVELGLLMPTIAASVTNKSVEGQCGNLNQTSLFIEDTVKNTTSKMSEITFQVGYRTPLSVGGTCKLNEWNLTMPLPNGQLQREMLDCSWRMFREPR